MPFGLYKPSAVLTWQSHTYVRLIGLPGFTISKSFFCVWLRMCPLIARRLLVTSFSHVYAGFDGVLLLRGPFTLPYLIRGSQKGRVRCRPRDFHLHYCMLSSSLPEFGLGTGCPLLSI